DLPRLRGRLHHLLVSRNPHGAAFLIAVLDCPCARRALYDARQPESLSLLPWIATPLTRLAMTRSGSGRTMASVSALSPVIASDRREHGNPEPKAQPQVVAPPR